VRRGGFPEATLYSPSISSPHFACVVCLAVCGVTGRTWRFVRGLSLRGARVHLRTLPGGMQNALCLSVPCLHTKFFTDSTMATLPPATGRIACAVAGRAGQRAGRATFGRRTSACAMALSPIHTGRQRSLLLCVALCMPPPYSALCSIPPFYPAIISETSFASLLPFVLYMPFLPRCWWPARPALPLSHLPSTFYHACCLQDGILRLFYLPCLSQHCFWESVTLPALSFSVAKARLPRFLRSITASLISSLC